CSPFRRCFRRSEMQTPHRPGSWSGAVKNCEPPPSTEPASGKYSVINRCTFQKISGWSHDPSHAVSKPRRCATISRMNLRPRFLLACVLSALRPPAGAQQPPNWTDQEKPIADQIKGLRALADDVRAQTTKQLALQIRELPATPGKLRLAVGLA